MNTQSDLSLLILSYLSQIMGVIYQFKCDVSSKVMRALMWQEKIHVDKPKLFFISMVKVNVSQ
eukprot:c29888_g1_i1 orf=154-342(+)